MASASMLADSTRSADRRPGALRVQGRDHPSVVPHPLRDFPAQAPGDERFGPGEPKVEQVVALLQAHVEDVAEPRGHQHAGLRAASFDDRVGDESGAVRNGLDLGHGHAFAPQEGGGAFNHRNRGVRRRGEALRHRDLASAFVEQREVGERAADVDAEPKGQGPGLRKSNRVPPCRTRAGRRRSVRRYESCVAGVPVDCWSTQPVSRIRPSSCARHFIGRLAVNRPQLALRMREKSAVAKRRQAGSYASTTSQRRAISRASARKSR